MTVEFWEPIYPSRVRCLTSIPGWTKKSGNMHRMRCWNFVEVTTMDEGYLGGIRIPLLNYGLVVKSHEASVISKLPRCVKFKLNHH